MRTLGTLPSLRISRNPLVALALFVLVIFAAYKAAEAILSGDLSSLAFAGASVRRWSGLYCHS